MNGEKKKAKRRVLQKKRGSHVSLRRRNITGWETCSVGRIGSQKAFAVMGSRELAGG